MTNEYRYGYFMAGTGKPHGQRVTLAQRFRLWKRRRKVCDLAGLRGWTV